MFPHIRLQRRFSSIQSSPKPPPKLPPILCRPRSFLCIPHRSLPRTRSLSSAPINLYSQLKSLARAGDFEACDGHVRAALESSQPIHPRSWEILIEASVRVGDATRAASYFEQMQRSGTQPERRSYAAMVQLHAQRGSADEAAAYWEEMSLRGMEPDAAALAALVAVLGRRGRPDDAERFYAAAAERGARPTAAVLHALLGALGRNGALERMEHYHAELPRLGLDPDAAPAVSALITGYCAGGHLHEAIRVYVRAVEKGVRLEGGALSSLIRLAVKRGEAAAAHTAGLRPALDTFVALLAHETRGEHADALFASLRQWKLRPNRAVYVALLQCQARARRSGRAEQIAAEMLSEGFSLDDRSLAALVEAHSADGNLARAQTYLQQMKDASMLVEKPTLEAFARAVEMVGDNNRAQWLKSYKV